MSATIAVTVVPFSPRDELVTFNGDGAVIKVTCGPEEGQANKAVIDLLSTVLGVKPYQLTLLKGHYRANKVVQIAGIDQAAVLAVIDEVEAGTVVVGLPLSLSGARGPAAREVQREVAADQTDALVAV